LSAGYTQQNETLGAVEGEIPLLSLPKQKSPALARVGFFIGDAMTKEELKEASVNTLALMSLDIPRMEVVSNCDKFDLGQETANNWEKSEDFCLVREKFETYSSRGSIKA
jgi:hypothetical protein